MELRSARIVQFSEIVENKLTPYESIRVLGRVLEYDAKINVAIVGEPNKGASIATRFGVELDLVDRPRVAINSLVTLIGEVTEDGHGMRARLCVPSDGLDVQMYNQALHLRRMFLSPNTS